MSPPELAATVMLATRTSISNKNATREDVQAAMALLDEAKAWIASRWPNLAGPPA